MIINPIISALESNYEPRRGFPAPTPAQAACRHEAIHTVTPDTGRYPKLGRVAAYMGRLDCCLCYCFDCELLFRQPKSEQFEARPGSDYKSWLRKRRRMGLNRAGTPARTVTV